MTVLTFGWYTENKYPALTELMDLSPDLEIGNVDSEELAWARIKDLTTQLHQEVVKKSHQ